MRTLPLAACLAALSTPAVAGNVPKVDRGNGMFFNRPNATLDQALTDTGACRAIAEGAQSQITAIGVLTGGLGGVLGGALAGGRLKRVNVENCMLVRGWRLFAMTRAEGTAWKALPEAERTTLLTTMTGADAPARGTLLRVWRNDYAEPVLWRKD